jgi:hypothetical protein
MRTLETALTLLGFLALGTGCVKAYKPPGPGEPASLVKVKFAYDRAKALAGDTEVPIDLVAFGLHPDREASVAIQLSANWKTTGVETVTENENRSKQVTKSVTRSHGVGCTARVAVKPVAGAVLLLDYTNLLVTEGAPRRATFRPRCRTEASSSSRCSGRGPSTGPAPSTSARPAGRPRSAGARRGTPRRSPPSAARRRTRRGSPSGDRARRG